MRKRSPFGLGFNDDFFSDFDEIEEMMRKMLEQHFGGFEGFEPPGKGGQNVYGFTLSFGPEGKKEFKEFGNAPRAGGARQVQKQNKEQSDLLVDVIDDKDSVRVIAELPGVDEKHLNLKAFPKQLSIRVNDPQRFFAKTIALPAEVLWDSIQHNLKNGILEVMLKKKK